MSWLLGVMDDHRAAVRYDLLRHGYTLEQVGIDLAWPDAVAVLKQQAPAQSALYRELFPDRYNHDIITDRLETLAVLIVRGQHLLGKQSDVDDRDLPNTWDDLWSRPDPEPDVHLLTFSEIDERMGWASLGVDPASAPESYTLEEINRRMGWG